MKNLVFSPFYRINSKNELVYLNRQYICKLPKEEEIKEIILRKEGALLMTLEPKKICNSILVLEPHPDDFALSAFGYVFNNYNINVLNIFSKTTLEYFAWHEYFEISENEYEETRLIESKLVIEEMLKQKFYSLREKSMRITEKNKENIEEIILNNIEKFLNKDTSIKEILVPMGIGEHPDHSIIYEAIMNNYSKFKNYKIILYPEYPYARCKKSYIDRINYISQTYIINPIIINIESNLDTMADCISAYKSQFDDVDRNQMLAIIREDCRAIAQEYNKNELSLVYFEVEAAKNEN